MQNLIYKILMACWALSLSFSLWGQTSDARRDLQLADSLFAAGKYTESFELYDYIFNHYQQYSRGMLLKMAFIKEGLGDFSQSLYYLNLYYARTSDKRALRKMEELAKQHQLKGYQFTDLDFFRTLYRRFSVQIIGGLGAMALFIFSFIIWQKRRGIRPLAPGISFVVVLGVLFVLLNFAEVSNKAIVLTDQAYVREAPSSAADVVGIIGKGNRVQVSSQQDVWVRVEWEDRQVYVRESHLARIES